MRARLSWIACRCHAPVEWAGQGMCASRRRHPCHRLQSRHARARSPARAIRPYRPLRPLRARPSQLQSLEAEVQPTSSHHRHHRPLRTEYRFLSARKFWYCAIRVAGILGILAVRACVRTWYVLCAVYGTNVFISVCVRVLKKPTKQGPPVYVCVCMCAEALANLYGHPRP